MPKVDLSLEPALMNAAGTLGFAADLRQAASLERLGAFVTNPISLERGARQPKEGAIWNSPAGFCCTAAILIRA